jgi:hypothetical protein
LLGLAFGNEKASGYHQQLLIEKQNGLTNRLNLRQKQGIVRLGSGHKRSRYSKAFCCQRSSESSDGPKATDVQVKEGCSSTSAPTRLKLYGTIES